MLVQHCRNQIRYTLLIATTLSSLFSGCAQEPDLELARRFHEAESLFAKADSPEEFQKVAAMHQEILESGFNSGVVHYNQGNAWLQAGQRGRAIAAYRQAERQLPRDPYVRANLTKALNQTNGPEGTSVPLWDHFFFWQQSVSYLEKQRLATLMLAGSLILGAFTQLPKQRKFALRLFFVMSILLLLLAVSIGRDWYSHEHTLHAVVVGDTVVRKGGSESYEPVFTQPVGDGTECIVLSRQRDWLHIQISADAMGWVPLRSVVTY